MTIEEKAKEYESNIGSQDYVPTEIEEAFEAGDCGGTNKSYSNVSRAIVSRAVVDLKSK